MQTLIRLLLKEQSDLGLHCLLRERCTNTLGCHGNSMSGRQGMIGDSNSREINTRVVKNCAMADSGFFRLYFVGVL